MKNATRTRPVSWPLRLVSAVFFLIQPFVCCPAAFAQAVVLAQTSQAENPADGEPGLNMPSGEPVAVNKTLPLFTPPGNFALSANPSDDQITRCGLFAEPLVPLRPRVAGAEANTENTALATVLKRYVARTDSEDVSPLSDFCAQNAESRWEAALQHNLGLIAYQQGYFSQALAHWEQAWEIGKKATQFQAVALANESLAQPMRMNARLGRTGRVKVLLADARKSAADRKRGVDAERHQGCPGADAERPVALVPLWAAGAGANSRLAENL
jgi:hypothetical protein